MEEAGGGRSHTEVVLCRLSSLVVRIALAEKEDFERLYSYIRQCGDLCEEEECLRELCSCSYKIALTNRCAVRNMIVLWIAVWELEAEGINFKSIIIDLVMKEFQEREKMREEDPERVVNAAILLGGVLYYMGLAEEEKFQVFELFIEYLTMVMRLSPDGIKVREDELEVVVSQICLNGQLLNQHDGDKIIEDFKLTLRCSLIDEFTSLKSIVWVQLSLDLSLYDWNLLEFPKHVLDFYSKKLGQLQVDQLINNLSCW